MNTKTETLIAALRILAVEVQSGDGVANSAIAEAADRLEELTPSLDLHNRLPQRFQYRKTACVGLDFGVCWPMGRRWKIQCGVGFGTFDTDPWEILGQILGDVEEFRWIDNDYGWHEQ